MSDRAQAMLFEAFARSFFAQPGSAVGRPS